MWRQKWCIYIGVCSRLSHLYTQLTTPQCSRYPTALVPPFPDIALPRRITLVPFSGTLIAQGEGAILWQGGLVRWRWEAGEVSETGIESCTGCVDYVINSGGGTATEEYILWLRKRIVAWWEVVMQGDVGRVFGDGHVINKTRAYSYWYCTTCSTVRVCTVHRCSFLSTHAVLNTQDAAKCQKRDF